MHRPAARCLAPMLLLAGCLGRGPAGSPADSSPAASGTVRVATWNVHDLFDEVDRTEPPGNQDTVLSHAQVEEKLARVGAVLARIDADLVVLQEVENRALLERLADGPLAGLGYLELSLTEGLDPRGIDIGVLSRLPIEVVSHLGERDPEGRPLWSRDLVEIHLRAGAGELILLANHFASQAGDADDRRTAQARAARAWADQLAAASPSAPVLVLGDLNDEPGSAPLQPLLGDGRWVDLGADLPEDRGVTYAAAGFRSRLDYLLVHAPFLATVAWFETLAGPDVEAASDHRPLAVDLLPP